MSQKITSPAFFIGKQEEGLISFGSGQPDLPPPEEAYEVLPTYRDFKYGPVKGSQKLREKLATKYPNAIGNNFVISNGASEGLDLVLRALYQPGIKILLPRPYYYSYPHNVELAHATAVYYDLEQGKINFENFKKQIEGCRAVIINSPSNPTGTVQDLQTLKKIEDLSKEMGVYVISDEVYKDLIYDRENYLLEGSHVITLNSFSKTYAMCGFRVGYIYAREQWLIDKITEMKTHTSMNTNILGQEMALRAMSAPQSFIDKQVAIWKERRDFIFSGLKAMNLELSKPEGAFYVLPKVSNSGQAVDDLYFNHQVVCYDGAWFGAPEHIRLSYALNKDKIEEGLKRIKKYLENR